MRIVCNHGYFKFFEEKQGEIAKFNTRYGQDLKFVNDYYTFTGLSELNNYSIKGALYSNMVSTKTYAGEPWEIMRQNGFVFNFVLGVLSNILITGNFFKPVNVGAFKYSEGLVLPGSYSYDARKVTGYTCRFDFDSALYRYTEFYYE